MDLHWILSPAVYWMALALALISYLILYVSLKREIHAKTVAARQAGESTQGSLGELAKDVQALKDGMRLLEEAPAVPLPGEAINLTKRAQALRMYRRGETISTIAAALRAPQNEIRLLVKVHETLNSQES